MKLSIVNPNATASMTALVARTAKALVAPGTIIDARTNAAGPLSIEGVVDGARAVPGMLAELEAAEREGAQAHIIACFDDTGLDAARSLLCRPVIGIGEAGVKAASFVSNRFAVITTLGVSVPVLEDNLRRYGLEARAVVRASELPVLALEVDPRKALSRISAVITHAMETDRVEAIVLGCAGMTEMAEPLSDRHGLPVVDGVAAAVKFAEGLAGLGFQNSSRGLYSPPRGEREKIRDAGEVP